jgi:hypothetical protein
MDNRLEETDLGVGGGITVRGVLEVEKDKRIFKER